MTNPKVSIVTGTYMRLPHLQRMVESARQAVGYNPHEIIVVDAGSTDGTVEWCVGQDDIVFIQQGVKLGPILAFNAGAAVARADLVLLANDDIEFAPNSISRAIWYLTEHPRTGAVAFRNIVRSTNPAFRRAPLDYYAGYLYPQVGLIRRFLGELAGWWGDYKAYGGDTQLGMRLWEMGWSVDEVGGCEIIDYVLDDDLRAANHDHRTGASGAQKDSQVFVLRWRGRLPDRTDWTPAPDRTHILRKAVAGTLRTMRFKSTYKDIPPRTGCIEAFEKYGPILQIDQGALARTHGLVRFQDIALQQVRNFQPDLILLQTQGPDNLTPETIKRIRQEFPRAVVVNFNGDARVPVPDFLIEVAKLVDLSLIISPTLFSEYAKGGATSLAYWPISYEPEYVTFPRRLSASSPDVVFLGNNYPSAAHFPDSGLRASAIRALLDAKIKLEVRGSGWRDVLGYNPGISLEDHTGNIALYSRSRLALSISHFSSLWGYSSDRLVLACATGIPVLAKRFPGMEVVGYEDGKTVIGFDTVDELVELAGHYLAHPDEAEAIGQAGKALVTSHHSWDVRARELLYMLQVHAPIGSYGSEIYLAANGSSLWKSPSPLASTPERTLAMPAGLPQVPPGHALIRYTGDNLALAPYHGAVTGRTYKAGVSRPLLAVDDRDVPELLRYSDGGRAIFQVERSAVPLPSAPARYQPAYQPTEPPDEMPPPELLRPPNRTVQVTPPPTMPFSPRGDGLIEAARMVVPDELDTVDEDAGQEDTMDDQEAAEVMQMLKAEQAAQAAKLPQAVLPPEIAAIPEVTATTATSARAAAKATPRRRKAK